MKLTTETLKKMKPETEFFIGIDSDGCAFDTMELKQKECFHHNVVYYFNLQSISKYARETLEFVNLYSKSRGCNRFIAIEKTFDFLAKRPEVAARNMQLPDITPLKDWLVRETKLGNQSLDKEIEQNPDPFLKLLYEWSVQVNKDIEKMVKNVPPFPMVKESLECMQGRADVLVVSQTPLAALEREWEEHGVDRYVRYIAGQELGTKSEHIAYAADGKYGPNKVLMIGDAPGDLKAAKDNGALFFPIVPGREEASWQRFHDEALERFFSGTFHGDYERELLEEFEACLPERPRWKELQYAVQ